ncbi:hybrid sensor histidine kinase/response regulator [Parabacteroides goldsteinii]|jgi:Signal transduction histidine kinase|uniref:hybrid sensor histidine kinase/response regulator n=1 Tax=Parabacteroides goldsteinii TaxID=328812 RepID=UPI000E9ECDF3|nr:response regulator [Parabacteroides goldsteinii]HBA31216.1 hybrid sensor histidine kinase/response regulator [Parabacteroides goldsteinii]
MDKRLTSNKSLANYQYLMDTIWTIYLEDGSVEIQKDSMIPELENTKHDYVILNNTIKNDVYPPDHILWDETVSLEAFHKMIAEGCFHKKFDMRFCNKHFGFEWHEAFIDILTNKEGIPDRVVLSSHNVNDFRKSQIIETAVKAEYDYVIYIEASKNSYVMYTSSTESETPPPVASSNYEAVVAEYNRQYMEPEFCDAMTEKMSIAHVDPILRQHGEYILYGTMIENGEKREKKMRFSYFDREQNIWLMTRTDITEIKEERKQKLLLQEALQSATAANRAKSDFLSRMSHDVRTPINAIVGMTAIAGLHMNDQNRIADCLKKITISSKLLLNLINEVLDMSKLESGKIMLTEETFKLDELLESLFIMVQSAFEAKKQKLVIHSKVKHECLIGDVQRIQQALLNMLTNAIKYTPNKGLIQISVEEKPSVYNGYGQFEIAVTDNGIGMKPEFLSKVFEPFERSDDKAIRNIQGTGLGMAISRHIAQMMNGDILVESEYGKGSKFTMRFHVKLGGMDEYDNNLLIDLPVLVVDDDDISCEIACENLQELGMKPEWVLSGQDAVQKVSDGNKYFAIIIDLMMPNMNGIETTYKIRECVGPDVPIIIISAYDYSDYEIEALKAGVNGFICKPIMKSKLFLLMKKFATNKKEEEEVTIVPSIVASFPGKRILVVEDNDLNREIAYELLQETGAEIETASDGLEAVNKVSASPEGYYDFIIMDIQMPVMDGLEATRQIRLLDRQDTKDLPIVAMSANAFAEDVRLSLEAGMNEHIAKPIEIDRLYSVMGKWFR